MASRKGEYLTCPICRNIFYKVPSQTKRKTCSRKCWHELEKRSGIRQGGNCNWWEGGHDEYRGPNWFEMRNLARIRDNNTCQVCGKTELEQGYKLIVHHVVPYRFFQGDYKKANELQNLLCVCHNCHAKTESHMWFNVPDEYLYLLDGLRPNKELSRPRQDRYSKEEIALLKENYPSLGPKDTSKLLGRPEYSVIDKAAELGVKYEFWTEREIEIITENYSKLPKKEMDKLLPGRNYSSVKAFANRRGLIKNNRWREEEKAIIYQYYPIYGIIRTTELLPNRNRNQVKAFIDNHRIKKQIIPSQASEETN